MMNNKIKFKVIDNNINSNECELHLPASKFIYKGYYYEIILKIMIHRYF